MGLPRPRNRSLAGEDDEEEEQYLKHNSHKHKKKRSSTSSDKRGTGHLCSLPYSYTCCLLCFSVALNALFYFRHSLSEEHHHHHHHHHHHPQHGLSFSPDGSTSPLPHAPGRLCSGHGQYDSNEGIAINGEGVNGGGKCRCYPCFNGDDCSHVILDCVINFDHGDPKMFQDYWSRVKDVSTTMLWGGDKMSYFSNTKDVCWFLEPVLASEIKALHELVGNAAAKEHFIIVGTGSSQLIHAALYALASPKQGSPVDVISAAPYYSSYPPMTDFLQSGLHRWAGDALRYVESDDTTYIELVTSPGNPDGLPHSAVLNGTGPVVHDLAYYWPHFTPIVSTLDHDIMLFTISKGTGHAGTRIGWALVRDVDVAKKMTKYIELNTIGVSKDSQVRASQIIRSVRNGYASRHKLLEEDLSTEGLGSAVAQKKFFNFGYKQMQARWAKLQGAVNGSACFALQEFPAGHCGFFGKETSPHPAFAWLRCEEDDDCHAVFTSNGILTRSGVHFGASSKYVRISMVDYEANFELFIDRLRRMSCAR